MSEKKFALISWIIIMLVPPITTMFVWREFNFTAMWWTLGLFVGAVLGKDIFKEGGR